MADPPQIQLDPIKYLNSIPQFSGNINELSTFTRLIDRIHPVLLAYDGLSQSVFSDIIKSRITGREQEIPIPLTETTAGGSAFYKKTKSLVEFSGQPSGDEASYPSEWFTKGNKKPKLVIKTAKDTTLASLRSYVYDSLATHSLTKDLAMWYVYQELSTINEPLTEPWVSFGIEIAMPEEGANPFSPVDVAIVDVAPAIPPSTKVLDQYVYWMLTCVLAMYRLSRTSYSDYRSKLSTALKDQSEIIRPKDSHSYDDMANIYGTWKDDANYRKMIASIDMFYSKFPGRDYSLVRFGTVSARYKDCAALSSLFNLKKTMGMDKECEVSFWIGCEVIADEFVRITKPGQEVERADSYFPYMIDFGLTLRSPYSSIINPNFYFFASTAAFLMGSSRSKNAVYHEINSARSVLMNSILVGYAFAKRANNETQFFPTADDMNLHFEDKEMQGTLQAGKDSVRVAAQLEPLSRDCDSWFTYMGLVNWEYTENMKRFCLTSMRNLTNLRETSLRSLLPLPDQQPENVL